MPSRRCSCTSASSSTVRRMASARSATCSRLVHAREHYEFLAAIAGDRAVVLLDRIAEGIGDEDQAAVAFLVAVAVIEFFEEVDVDEDRRKAAAELLPVAPVVPQLLVDGPAILQARQRIGSRQSAAAPGRARSPPVLDLGFEGVQEDVVTLLVQVPVHIGGECESTRCKRSRMRAGRYPLTGKKYRATKNIARIMPEVMQRKAKLKSEETDWRSS